MIFHEPKPMRKALTFDQLSDAAPDRPHYSWSQLTSYLMCPLGYRLKYVEKVPQRPGWALVGGKVLHSIVETHLKYDLLPDPVKLFDASVEAEREASDFTVEEFYAAAAGKENREWWRGEIASMANNSIKAIGSVIKFGDYQIIDDGIERRLTAEFGGVNVLGFADLLTEHATDRELYPIDLKSGSRAPNGCGQLELYAAMMDRPASEGAYIMARKGQVLKHRLSPDPKPKFDYQFGQLKKATESGVYPANESVMCGSCSVRHACPIKG